MEFGCPSRMSIRTPIDFSGRKILQEGSTFERATGSLVKIMKSVLHQKEEEKALLDKFVNLSRLQQSMYINARRATNSKSVCDISQALGTRKI